MLGIKIIKNIYIIGAGLAGLSASVHGIKKNYNINFFESSNLVGGRCRSFYEKKLGFEIDNGNHLVFSANTNFYELCKIIGSTDRLIKLPSDLKFYDLKKNIHWNLNIGNISFINLLRNKMNLIPDTNMYDYFSILKFLFVGKNKTVADIVGESKIFKTLWDPFTIGVMNTSSKKASAKILSNVLKKTVFKGEKFCQIYQPLVNWNDAIIKPCVNFVNKNGFKINFKKILKKIEIINDYITKLHFNNQVINISKNDIVLFAIPPSNLLKILPMYNLPIKYNCIINIHFKLPIELKKSSYKIIGLINSYSHWLFIKDNYLSITISNANYLNDFNSDKMAELIWKEICSCLNINKPIPDYQVVKEKKATIEQSPTNFELVKRLNDLPRNLRISGDWTQTSLPCTIEGSILSGKKAVN